MCIFGVTFTYVIEGIDSKVISVCLIDDYSLIADLYIFIYTRAECEYVSLKCTKVKLSILNHFDIGNAINTFLYVAFYVIVLKFLFHVKA